MQPNNPPTNQTRTWFRQTFTLDYFKRVAFALFICLVIYLVYLFNKGGSVDLGALGIFVLMSFVTQIFFSQHPPK
ncbi:MAG TPA: hypothetical protein VMT46_14725 [Anaerolineaceae bacterium]|nr:hypothetical protein [Anaerolineaceae bacterium]